ncbi:MAG: hypothetical protein GX321_10365 [Clostridiales bacterium]|nr:hypothetical protein [Clostridiales bacterium]
MIFVIMLQVIACSPRDCKAKDCSEEVYKDGLCEEHYYEKAFKDGFEKLGELFN